LRKWGTTSVCNIEAFPELMDAAAPVAAEDLVVLRDDRHSPPDHDGRPWWPERFLFQHRGNSLDSFGLNPHAPYTASLNLYQLANACASSFSMPLNDAPRGICRGVLDVSKGIRRAVRFQ